MHACEYAYICSGKESKLLKKSKKKQTYQQINNFYLFKLSEKFVAKQKLQRLFLQEKLILVWVNILKILTLEESKI